MRLTNSQHLELRNYLQGILINKKAVDEVYDHIITSLENKSLKNYSLKNVQEVVQSEFDSMINKPEEMLSYKKFNFGIGMGLFFFATLVYWLTMEPTVSFWDCGEFISAAYKMQVGHQPGAPLFLMIGKLFSLLAMGDVTKVAYWTNFSSVVASGATIMFLFWTITALAQKIYQNRKLKDKASEIFLAGVVGALAYTFSDTFWFSAVESEVYALSSLFTAVTFWAILKWEQNMDGKWLLFIAFVIGLSIGVHLLSLLTIPAMALVYYFKTVAKPNFKGLFIAFLIGCLLLGVVQVGIIQYVILFAAKSDLLFVNSLGLSFGSGALVFFLVLFGCLGYGIFYSLKRKKANLNLALLSLFFLLFGFSSYFAILIRANAKPSINLSNPDNLFSLYNYLGRVNYIPPPLIYGNTFDAKVIENKVTGTTYRKGKSTYDVTGNTYKTIYDKNLIFPRTYSQRPDHVSFYKEWMGLNDQETPSLRQNINFFASWQLGFMYWRYFMWNFAGKQNDIQGYGSSINGNWLSGIKAIDSKRLGNQENLPPSVIQNNGHNLFYCMPLILGLLGLYWLLKNNKQIVLVIGTLFVCTGIAIIIYINQDPFQVRERDYAYVGSFYAFAVFIGFGTLLIKDVFLKIFNNRWGMIATGVICLIAVPLLMAFQGWDDHNRSNKYTARDWAKNYLNSCAPNAILFTNADNDTYPLWYAQEVEGIRTDVRVICVQFLSDPSFLNQLKKELNTSPSINFYMHESLYAEGVREYMPFVDYGITDSVELKDLVGVMTSQSKADMIEMNDGSFSNFLPTKKIKLTVNRQEVIANNFLDDQQLSNLLPTMEWSFNKNYASKGDLAMFDILSSNNWKRPIYFATMVSEDTYIGLDKYLYLEGYAYRLLPVKSKHDVDKMERTNTDKMLVHMNDMFDLSGFKKAKYLDPESRRVLNSTWGLANTLTENLLAEKKDLQAAAFMRKIMRDLPSKNYGISDTLIRLNTIQNLYNTNEKLVAEKLNKETNDFIELELNYIASLDEKFKKEYVRHVQLGLYILTELQDLARKNGQQKLALEVEGNLKKFSSFFMQNG